MRYVQKNISISAEQMKFINNNFGKMNISKLSKSLGINYNKVHNNMRLMGLVNPRKQQVKVIKMEGYFDMDEFAKKYTY